MKPKGPKKRTPLEEAKRIRNEANRLISICISGLRSCKDHDLFAIENGLKAVAEANRIIENFYDN